MDNNLLYLQQESQTNTSLWQTDGANNIIPKNGKTVPNQYIEDISEAYVYIAYATDALGTNFSLTPSNLLTYMAVLSSDTEIPTPQVSDFVGLWRVTKGDTGAQGLQGPIGPQGLQGIQGNCV
jgi:hypothetical protein